jgi:hypothetical protein
MGSDRQGEAWFGKDWLGRARIREWIGRDRLGEARRGRDWFGSDRRGSGSEMDRLGVDGCGMARLGMVGRGSREGWVWRDNLIIKKGEQKWNSIM